LFQENMLNLYVRPMQGTASSKSKACSLASVQVPAYRLKLPPKRLFVHNPTPDFVEERRQQLDTYLQMLLQERQLQGLHYFLSCHNITCKLLPQCAHLWAAAPLLISLIPCSFPDYQGSAHDDGSR